MWPFSQPKCPICKGNLVPNSGTIGHAAYKCPSCIKRNTPQGTHPMTAPQTDAPTWHQIEVAALVNVISVMEAEAKKSADALDARDAVIAELVEALGRLDNLSAHDAAIVCAALAKAAALK